MTHSTLKTTHLYQHSNGTHAVILLLFWALVFAGEAFRRAPLDVTLEFWTILPPLLFPVWLHHKWDLFLWTKTLTLIPIATIWCSIIRFRIDARWTRLGSFAILSVNIAEALFKDYLSKQGTWNRLNALSGLLLILKVLPSLDTLHIREDEPFDVLWSLSPCWIIGERVDMPPIVCHLYKELTFFTLKHTRFGTGCLSLLIMIIQSGVIQPSCLHPWHSPAETDTPPGSKHGVTLWHFTS